MPNIPVLCHNCETLFVVNTLEGAILDQTLLGDNPFPCPSCHKMGYTLTGFYSNLNKTIEVILSDNNTKESLNLLIKKLREVNVRKIEPSIFHKAIPELKGINTFLPKTRIELYAFITAIVAILTFLITTFDFKENQIITQQEIQQVTNNTINIIINNKR